MQALAYKAYGEVTQRTAGTNAIEYAVFEQITEALEKVEADGGSDLTFWADALHRNMQLWTLITTDLLSPDNALATETKTGLISLSEFVRRTSHKVLSGGEGLTDLIEVNRIIMAGLGGARTRNMLEQG